MVKVLLRNIDIGKKSVLSRSHNRDLVCSIEYFFIRVHFKGICLQSEYFSL